MIAQVPLSHALLLCAILFSLGLLGLLARRNLIFALMSVEIMLNSAALAFVVAGSRWGQADGQLMFILVISLAAAEAAVGLAITLLVYRQFQTLDLDQLNRLAESTDPAAETADNLQNSPARGSAGEAAS